MTEKVMLLIFLVLLAGCEIGEEVDPNETIFKDYSEPDFDAQEIPKVNETKPLIKAERYQAVPVVDESDYVIGSWNVQIFGEKKANSNVMPVIQEVIEGYDILAIQEIRDKTGTVIGKLNEIPGYDLRFSKRLGRTSSMEQYAFIFSKRVDIGECRLYPDVQDVFEREPWACEFIIDDNKITLVQVHIKPDDAEQEMRYLLGDVVDWTKESFGKFNIFVLGDLNADCLYFDTWELFGGYQVLIDNDKDTTTGRTVCAYDRIIATEIDQRMLDAGVDNLNETKGNKELLEALSDHYPVFMIFDRADY